MVSAPKMSFALAALFFYATISAGAQPVQQLSSKAMRDAENATVLISGYVDTVSGCWGESNSPEPDAAACAKQRDASVNRSWYRCAGVAEGIRDAQGRGIEVLTARHCIEPSRRTFDGAAMYVIPDQSTIQVRFRDGDTGRFDGVIQDVVQSYDIVSIHVQARRPHRSVAHPEFSINPGEQLHVLGNFANLNWGWKDADSVDGTQASLIDDWAYTSMLECRLCNEGDSGAGVWSNDGRLVGIFNAVTQPYGLFTPSLRIRVLGTAAL